MGHMSKTLQNAVILKERVSDQIKSILKQSILDGEFKPGDKFPPEIEIAEKLQVSKVSIREALRELETEGLVKKNGGLLVEILLPNQVLKKRQKKTLNIIDCSSSISRKKMVKKLKKLW